jgi:hypothetical protein
MTSRSEVTGFSPVSEVDLKVSGTRDLIPEATKFAVGKLPQIVHLPPKCKCQSEQL